MVEVSVEAAPEAVELQEVGNKSHFNRFACYFVIRRSEFVNLKGIYMYCPNCKKIELKEHKSKKVDIEYCPTCKGLWFDQHELEKCLKTPYENLKLPKDAEEGNRLCPHCTVFMHRFSYPDTFCIVDMCNECNGIWLDDQELKEINVVRNHLEETGELEIPGIKGVLIRFINKTIEDLTALC